jgi:hypothetical protein
MCFRVYEVSRDLEIISFNIPIKLNIVFLDDIFFYEQGTGLGGEVICTFPDGEVGVVEEQIITV